MAERQIRFYAAALDEAEAAHARYAPDSNAFGDEFLVRDMIHRLVILCCATIALTGCGANDGLFAATQNDDPQARVLRDTGARLRSAIDGAVQDMKAAHKVSADLSVLVQGYIPVGMSFDEAEGILRAAGCTVAPRRATSSSSNAVDEARDGVNARFFLESHLFGSVQFGVQLLPRAPGDYSRVHGVHAGIYPVWL